MSIMLKHVNFWGEKDLESLDYKEVIIGEAESTLSAGKCTSYRSSYDNSEDDKECC
jgi:hypothetical protein